MKLQKELIKITPKYFVTHPTRVAMAEQCRSTVALSCFCGAPASTHAGQAQFGVFSDNSHVHNIMSKTT